MATLEAEIKVCISQRDSLFAILQNVLEFSKKMLKRDKSTLNAFAVKIRSLETVKENFLKIVERINLLEIQWNPEFEPSFKPVESFLEIYSLVLTAYDELERVCAKGASAAPQAVNPDTSKPKIKLPTLELPVFNGESTTDWVIFYDLFKSMIHDRTDLSNTEKCQYLLSKLSGKALACCASLPATPDNYEILFQGLVDKYNDRRILANTYLDTLFSFKTTKTESLTSLSQFVDKFGAAVSALKALNLENLGDSILVYLATNKLPMETIKSFERSLKKDEIPSSEQLMDFIKDQLKILTRVQSTYTPPSTLPISTSFTSKPKVTHSFLMEGTSPSLSQPKTCLVCRNGFHPLFKCDKFHSMSPRDRYSTVRANGCCLNCISQSHNVKNCVSKTNCNKCGKRHHSLLHFPVVRIENVSQPKSDLGAKSASDNVVSLCSTLQKKDNGSSQTVLLSTVKVKIKDSNGKDHLARLLLDSGSQSHFVTKSFCDELKLDLRPCTTAVVSGLGAATRRTLGQTSLRIQSTVSDSSYSLEALVVPAISDRLPAVPICKSAIEHFLSLELADDSFGVPGEIHGLIGAELYPYLLLSGHIKVDSMEAMALNTTLGYVIMGTAKVCDNPADSVFCGLVDNRKLETMVQRFWEQEEIAPPAKLLDESEAEIHFRKNCRFDPDENRYVVKMPFKLSPERLGGSHETTLRRFLALENKLEKCPDQKAEYSKAIKEMLEAQHLTQCQEGDAGGYFVPHHMVTKESSLTTKLRIVYDFSCPSSNGVSLNDLVHKGPKLYNDLFNIILNFRLFEIALVADISKMFLQIIMDEEHQQYQKIYWRFNKSEPVQTYRLNRVTFGHKSSPYLAQRVIRQLAMDKEVEYPLVKPAVENEFYMDDFTASVKTLVDACQVQKQLTKCFKTANFDLVKWGSNKLELVSQIPEKNSLLSLVNWDSPESIKILGMVWDPSSDHFTFNVHVEPRPCTKRVVLSDLAKIWDPIGLISPVTVYCKIILQSLWKLNLSWDSPAPQEVAKIWHSILVELKLLTSINVPRHINVFSKSDLSLIGFSDASERACSAVVYARTIDERDQIKVELLCSKSKVAPLKRVSIPRLELNAALLLARLISSICNNYQHRHPISNVMCLVDSTVALHWIKASPYKWQTYVANRVTKIQELVPSEKWWHISGEDNSSADCLSRGLTPSQLVDHPTWFAGPPFLKLDYGDWPISVSFPCPGPVPEEKVISLTVTQSKPNFFLEITKRFSSWNKLLNTLVRVYRFLRKLPRRNEILASDLHFVETKLWLAVQSDHLDNWKRFSKLSPFLDAKGLIRVGGRLRHSTLNYDQKHPILLPKDEHVIVLLIRYTHQNNLHTGSSLVLSILRQRYWILSARSLVKKIVQSCNKCFRLYPKTKTPLMGDLPKFRVEEVKPFFNTGVDFAGPVKITLSKHRGIRTQKAYLCLFICLATKALHLELVSDLSKEAFVNALKRFLARRGPVGTIYSDNGTNFIGTKNMLDELYTLLYSKVFQDQFGAEMVKHRIHWKTLPPSAPHMAGIWERAVRSCKTHLFKVIGDQILTYEELTTVLTQIEALLNSRPLCVLSSDPNDLESLTPAHFLKLTPLHHLPAENVESEKLSRLTRFRLLDNLVQSFWRRWSLEYLNSLQERSKWRKSCGPNITVGTVVVLKEDSTVPLHWKLGIVEEVHPGADGVVRVATVKTSGGSFRRPVVKLCLLPSQ